MSPEQTLRELYARLMPVLMSAAETYGAYDLLNYMAMFIATRIAENKLRTPGDRADDFDNLVDKLNYYFDVANKNSLNQKDN